MRINFRFRINTLTLLIALNLIAFAIAFIIPHIVTLKSGYDYFDYYELIGALIFQGNYFNWSQLLTSAFLHTYILHFALNMYSLYRIGTIVQEYFDSKVLFFTYILGGIGGSLLTYLAFLIFKDPSVSLGASGAIFALLGLLIGASLKRYRYGLEFPFSVRDFLPLVVISLMIGFAPGGNVNNWAHIGGLLTGIAIGLIAKHSLGGHKDKTDSVIKMILFSVSIILLIASYLWLILNI